MPAVYAIKSQIEVPLKKSEVNWSKNFCGDWKNLKFDPEIDVESFESFWAWAYTKNGIAIKIRIEQTNFETIIILDSSPSN